MSQKQITVKEVSRLIQIEDGEAWTTSVVIAEQFGRPHKNVLQSLDALIADGTIERGLEIEPTLRAVPGPNGAVRQERVYRLNERAALIAMPFIGGRKSRDGQKRLVDAFLSMRKLLKQHDAYRHTAEWLESRQNGKVIRVEFTDGVKEFVEYATRQGSQNASKYYMALTKMENQALFLIGKAVGENFRDTLGTSQLLNLATAEIVAQRALREGMAKQLHYKDIYQLAKQKVLSLADLVGKTLPAKATNRIAA
jgi:phage regulator Rha-like protein